MPVQRVELFVPGLPPSPNSTRRLHWHQRSDEANVWKDAVVVALHAATGGRWSPIRRAELELVLVAKGGRRHDPDNLVAAAKPLIDGLVLSGLLVDDSFAVVERLSVTREAGPQTGIRMIVQELGS